MCESFFATLECELLARRRFGAQAEARMAIFRFIIETPHQANAALRHDQPALEQDRAKLVDQCGAGEH